MKATKKELREDESFVVIGPARIRGSGGRLRIAGEKNNNYTVREGEVAAVEALDDCTVSLTLGEGSSLVEKKMFSEVGFPQMWHRHTRDILATSPSLVMIAGGTDTGKTTFASFLARRGAEEGRRVALVDADMGQSDIGPPTTLGMAYVQKEKMSSLVPDALYFLGTTSVRSIEEVVVGTQRLVHSAREANLTIVDTCGFIHEEIGRRLKSAELEGLLPDFLVVLQRKDELEYLARAYPQQKVIRAQVPEGIVRIPKEARRKIRETRYRRAFKNALERMHDLEEMRVKNTYFRTGTRVAGAMFEKLLGCRVLHAEDIPEGYLVVREKRKENARDEARVSASTLRVLECGWEENLICGLEKEGSCIGIGTIKRIDYEREMINVFSERMDFDTIKFGRVYVNERGEEQGFLEWC